MKLRGRGLQCTRPCKKRWDRMRVASRSITRQHSFRARSEIFRQVLHLEYLNFQSLLVIANNILWMFSSSKTSWRLSSKSVSWLDTPWICATLLVRLDQSYTAGSLLAHCHIPVSTAREWDHVLNREMSSRSSSVIEKLPNCRGAYWGEGGGLKNWIFFKISGSW